jgi:hypothetical protein
MLYSDAQIPPGVNEKDLVIGFWNSTKNEWESLAVSVIDTVNNQITAPLSHFSTCAILYLAPEAAPASFTVGNLSVSPSEASAGQEVTISTAVTNAGGSPGTYTVSFKLNGTLSENREVNLDSGKSENLVFKTKSDKPGTYAIEVNGKTGQFTIKEPVVKVAEPISTPSSSPKTTPIASPTKVTVEKPAVSSNPVTTSPISPGPQKDKPPSPNMWIVLLGVIVTGAIVGGVVVLLRRKTDKDEIN